MCDTGILFPLWTVGYYNAFRKKLASVSPSHVLQEDSGLAKMRIAGVMEISDGQKAQKASKKGVPLKAHVWLPDN